MRIASKRADGHGATENRELHNYLVRSFVAVALTLRANRPTSPNDERGATRMNPADIVAIVGPDIGLDLTSSQRDRVADAIAEDEGGVRRIALDVMGKKGVRSHVPVFLAELDKGRHRYDPRRSQRAAETITVLDFAERRYRARLDTYPELGIDEAVEYAVDSTKLDLPAAGSHDALDLEKELRERVGQEWTNRQTPMKFLPPAEQAKLRDAVGRFMDGLRGKPLLPSIDDPQTVAPDPPELTTVPDAEEWMP
jgi:hypothetical protein